MRWTVLLLVLANLGLAGYIVFVDRSAPVTDVRALEMNADQIRLLNAGVTQTRTACLEWSNLSDADLPRAQEQLGKLRPGALTVREGTIVIADPPPALIARLAELKGAFLGSELRAIACLPNAP